MGVRHRGWGPSPETAGGWLVGLSPGSRLEPVVRTLCLEQSTLHLVNYAP
jgi:hypothetical protein